MSAYVTTIHPFEGQTGHTVPKAKYTQIQRAIVAVLTSNKEVCFVKLIEDVRAILVDNFDGSISWHVSAVKLDLEAKEKIVCVRAGDGQHISLNAENLSKRSLAKHLK